MASKEKVEFLRARLNEQIAGFGTRRQVNRTKAFWLRMAAVCCGALTTILIGLRVADSWEPVVRNCALAFSALVTIISSYDAFYNYRALWIRYTVTYTELRNLSTRLEYLTAGGALPANEAQIDQLFSEFQQILSETNAHWLQLRKETDPKHEK